MDSIYLLIAEILRPVIALLVKCIFHGIILVVMGPIWFVQFLFRTMNKGLGKQDRLRVTRFHQNNSHQAPKWKECRECVDFIGLVKSARAIAGSVAGEARDAEMCRFHSENSHQEPSWSGCRECLDYMEESRSTLRLALIQKTGEGIADAVMTPFHKQSSHREPSWTDCRTCIEYIKQIEVGPLDRIIPPSSPSED